MSNIKKLEEIIKQTEIERTKIEKEYQRKLEENERTLSFMKKST